MAWYDYPFIDNYREQYDFAGYPVNGLDIPMPMGTPVTAVWNGIVTKRYYDAGGGQVIIKVDNTAQSKGVEYYNFRHLDQINSNIQEGTRVKQGDILGQSGGQNSGGNHPAAPNYSSGPHLGIGLSHSNFIPYTLDMLTPELYPKFMIDYAKNVTDLVCTCPAGYMAMCGGDPVKYSCGCFNPSTKEHKDCNEGKVETGVGTTVDKITSTLEWLNDPIRVVKILMGIMLIAGAIYLLIVPSQKMGTDLLSRIKDTVPK